MENQKLKMDNKINVNVLKHNSYNSDHNDNTVIKWKTKN